MIEFLICTSFLHGKGFDTTKVLDSEPTSKKKAMSEFCFFKNVEKDYALYALVFLVAMAARIFFFIWMDEPILFFKYPYFAEKLADGKEIGDRIVDLSPFYLYCLSIIGKAFNWDWLTIKLIQSVVGSYNALLIMALGSRLFNRTTGLFAALLYALYGNVIILESTLEPTVFVMLFDLLLVYFLVLTGDGENSLLKTLSLAASGGFFAGLSIITKPNALLFLPMGVVWLLFFQQNPHSYKKRMIHSSVFVISALFIVAPITIRNYIHLNEFVLVTADAGKVFYHGNSKSATVLSRATLPEVEMNRDESDEPDFAHVLFRRYANRQAEKTLSPSEASRFWAKRAIEDIENDPLRYFKRTLKKFAFFFTDYEVHYIASAYTEYKNSLSLPFIRYGIIASLALLGMLFGLPHFRRLFLLYGTVGMYLISCMLFLVQSRYRTPAVPFLCLFAGSAVSVLADMASKRNFGRLCLSILGCVVLLFVSHKAFSIKISQHDRWQEATKKCFQMRALPFFNAKRYEAAVRELNQCLSMVPDFVPALNLRGKAHAMLNHSKEAEFDFKKVISLAPYSSQGYLNMGFVCLIQGKTERARWYLNKANMLSPDDKKIIKALDALEKLFRKE